MRRAGRLGVGRRLERPAWSPTQCVAPGNDRNLRRTADQNTSAPICFLRLCDRAEWRLAIPNRPQDIHQRKRGRSWRHAVEPVFASDHHWPLMQNVPLGLVYVARRAPRVMAGPRGLMIFYTTGIDVRRPFYDVLWSATASRGSRRAIAAAPAAPGAPTIRLAAARAPSTCAASTARLTSSTRPKSSAAINQTFQCAISRRSRRKRKNSIPSRRRRFIISGLVAISPRIEAILPGRK